MVFAAGLDRLADSLLIRTNRHYPPIMAGHPQVVCLFRYGREAGRETRMLSGYESLYQGFVISVVPCSRRNHRHHSDSVMWLGMSFLQLTSYVIAIAGPTLPYPYPCSRTSSSDY